VQKQLSNKKRDLSYEVIRVIAMCLVIIVHELLDYYIQNLASRKYMAIEAALCVCNALFFLLAGRFAFKMKLDDNDLYKKYYWKKAIKLLIPVFVYSAIKNWHIMLYHKHLVITPYSYLRHFLISLVNGFSAMEYWFLYVLIACLIAAPFFARMVQNMSKKDKKAFFVVGMIMSTLATFIPLLGVDFAINYYFVGYVFIFFLGAMAEDIFETKKQKHFLYFAGCFAEIINIMLRIFAHYDVGYKSTSPLFVLFSLAVFIFLKNNIKAPKKSEKAILLLGKYSLGVYMIHCMILYTLRDVTGLPHGAGVFSILLASLITLAISFVLVVIIDSTIVKWLQKLVIKIFKLEKIVK
jgi:surface polysaccharide O-acyltransferase-like enzyme